MVTLGHQKSSGREPRSSKINGKQSRVFSTHKPTVELRGQVERITYTNEETGYTVARVKVRGHGDLVTVVGNLMSPTPGEILWMKGQWSSHPKYGEQFKIVYYRVSV